MYTQGARERRLKQQFSEHARVVLERSAASTGALIAGGLRRDMASVLEYLRLGVNETRESMEADIAVLSDDVSAALTTIQSVKRV